MAIKTKETPAADATGSLVRIGTALVRYDEIESVILIGREFDGDGNSSVKCITKSGEHYVTKFKAEPTDKQKAELTETEIHDLSEAAAVAFQTAIAERLESLY